MLSLIHIWYLVEQKKPSMRLEGQDGNIFNILGRASRLLKEAGQKGQADEMFRRVTSSGSYEEALHILSLIHICADQPDGW